MRFHIKKSHKHVVVMQLAYWSILIWDVILCLNIITTDTMDTWDQQKLEEVVEKKHGENEKKNTTEIVSRSPHNEICRTVLNKWYTVIVKKV